MELRQYLAIARRWAWLLILGLVLGLAGGYVGSRLQSPVYQSSTRVLVASAASQSSANDTSYFNDQQLAETYIQLLTTQPVLDAAAAKLGYSIEASQLSVEQIGYTPVIKLTVEDGDPAHAAGIANTLIESLIDQNEKLQSGRYAATEETLQAQISQVQAQLNSLQSQIDNASSEAIQTQLNDVQAQINTLQAQITTLENDILALKRQYPTTEQKAALAAKQADLDQLQPVLALYQQIYTNLVVLGKPVEGSTAGTSTRLTQLDKTLGLYQQIYINLLTSIESVRLARLQNTPNVMQIEPAAQPTQPIRPRPLQNMLLAGAVGLMLAAGIVFLVEYLDDTLRTPDDVERSLELPVVGFIAQMQYAKGSDEDIYVVRQPRSPVAEAFRSLRTNLEFAGVDKPLRRLLITSAGPNDGKTTIAANLAAIIAQGGVKVVLLDADMRKPQVHHFTGLSNRVGLSDLFRGTVPVEMVMQSQDWLEGVTVITSGSLPPNPTELLASSKMEALLQELEKRADMIVIDSPPSLVADVQVLAARVDGVLMVVQPGKTRIDDAGATLEQLGRAGAHVIGVVFNRIPRDRFYYYGGYRHYSPYYNRGYQYYSRSESPAGDASPESHKGILPALPRFSGNGGSRDKRRGG